MIDRDSLRTRRLGCVLVVAVILATGGLVTSAAAADSGVKSLGFALPENIDSAVDGTDVYWLEQGERRDRAKHRWIFETHLMRGSLANKSVVQLAVFNDAGDEVPESLAAGGGYLYVNFNDQTTLSNDNFDNSMKVVRMARDGSNRVTVAEIGSASGGTFVMENGVPKLNDCTKSVTATSVSFNGDVVISQRVSDRESRHCGHKKNADHWRYFEVSTAGARREITTEDSPVTSKFKFYKGEVSGVRWGPVYRAIADPWVYYGKAVYQRYREGQFFVKDLAAGGITGPFKTRIPGHDFFASAQVNSAGQLATNAAALTGSSKHEKITSRAGIFRTPGDPASFATMKGSAQLEFCGDHLIAVNNRGARELDPASFWLMRTVATGREIEGDYTYNEPACTDRYLYFTRYGPTNVVLLAYPLD